MTDKLVVMVTCSSPVEAKRIARAVVEARLAACGLRQYTSWRSYIHISLEK